jgi:hypothetical protein
MWFVYIYMSTSTWLPWYCCRGDECCTRVLCILALWPIYAVPCCLRHKVCHHHTLKWHMLTFCRFTYWMQLKFVIQASRQTNAHLRMLKWVDNPLSLIGWEVCNMCSCITYWCMYVMYACVSMYIYIGVKYWFAHHAQPMYVWMLCMQVTIYLHARQHQAYRFSLLSHSSHMLVCMYDIMYLCVCLFMCVQYHQAYRYSMLMHSICMCVVMCTCILASGAVYK